MILEYKVPQVNPLTGEYTEVRAYGCPVEVFVFGHRQRVLYQFPGAGQECAVVHQPSGQILAVITDEQEGYPQEKAQTALNDRLRGYDWRAVESAYSRATVLNPTVKLVGQMTR